MAAPGGGKGRPDWSQLLPEILEIISSKATEVTDYVRFRAICKAWRSATSRTNKPSWLPWLLLPYNVDSHQRHFLSLFTQRTHTLDFPQSRGHYIQGTAHGWLIMVDPSYSISLLNPLTQACIHLLQITFFPSQPVFKLLKFHIDFMSKQGILPAENKLGFMRFGFQYHVFLSGEGESLVAVSNIRHSQFLYCKVGDTFWTVLQVAASEVGIDALAYHGRRFYAIDSKGDATVWDLSSTHKKGRLSPSLKVNFLTSQLGMVVFVGDLLLVGFSLTDSARNESKKAAIYKLDDECGEMKWSELQCTNDRLIFKSFTEIGTLLMVVAGNASTSYSSEVCLLHHIKVLKMKGSSSTKEVLYSCEPLSTDLFRSTWVIPTC